MFRKAFTLIELLVVIAIIAILAAILFPVFAQAKEAAKKTTCLSNNKNMATAAFLYQGDYEDMYPQTSWEKDAIYTKQAHWTYLMQPYIKSYDIFLCPSDSSPVTPKAPCLNGNSDFGKLPMTCDWQAPKYSYITNYNVIPAHDWNTVNQSQFEEPSNMIIFTERRDKMSNGTSIGKHKGVSGFIPSQPCPGQAYDKSTAAATILGSTTWSTTDDEDANLGGAMDRVKYDRHTGGANYSYTDGHAKYQKLEQTLNPDKFQYGNKWLPTPSPAAGC